MTEAELQLDRLACLDGVPPGTYAFVEVVGMNELLPTPVSDLFESEASEFRPCKRRRKRRGGSSASDSRLTICQIQSGINFLQRVG
jgi:hypothetical protein